MTCLILSFQTDLLAKAAYDLPRQEALVRQIAHSGSRAAFEAHALLYMLYGEEFEIPLPLLPDAAATFIGTNNLGSIAFKTESTPSHVTIAPNPAHSSITLTHQIPTNGMGTWQLFDMNGRNIMSQNLFGTGTTNIDISGLPNGVYHYTLSNGGNLSQTDKLVIVR
ncbi:MAG: T9SS type A sorting domain-containing protein [Sphingobacteriales bacterium]|nr:T9SS type A sorting domain-containing protein [Sphingobacteriales bacterium]